MGRTLMGHRADTSGRHGHDAPAVVIDAVLADPPVPGRLHRIALGPADSHAVSSHGLGLGDAIGPGQSPRQDA
jgi:hypothetical protein